MRPKALADSRGNEANLVPFGGLSEIGILPGGTVIVTPATGHFGGGAVTTALATGATVITCGRSEETSMKLKAVFGHTGQSQAVVLTGNIEQDSQLMIAVAGNGGKGADGYIRFSPTEVAESTHISAALTALKSLAGLPSV